MPDQSPGTPPASGDGTHPSVGLTIDQGVARVELRRERVLNALDLATATSLFDTLHDTINSPQVKVVVLTGAGRGFCSGADLNELRRIGRSHAVALQQTIQRACRLLAASRKPTIAAVNGPAVGAGFGIAMMCDLRIASTTARFHDGAIRLGLVSGHGLVHVLTRCLGPARAREIMLLDRPIDAQRALELGLVCEVHESANLDERVRAVAQDLASMDSQALALTKQAIRIAMTADLETTMGFLREAITYSVSTVSQPAGRDERL